MLCYQIVELLEFHHEQQEIVYQQFVQSPEEVDSCQVPRKTAQSVGSIFLQLRRHDSPQPRAEQLEQPAVSSLGQIGEQG